ncbi:RagB/SusD family nutrient uptake outer membrane protein [Tamlana sp. I1]|uniref:RagB/SusD family nutrient uptake outer membrane protein n=1 Tax=Tamlana sp. I1 TaxID=2762061 RepID=UPI00188FD72E|nr:RagB/SusD family nutrient uptake outer membrane protein [Tamlana sp. I1]
MKKYLKISGLSILLLTVVINIVSCGQEYLDEAKVYTALDGTTFYTSEQDAVQAVTAAYTILQGRALYKVELYALEYSAGDYAMTEGGFQYANFENFQFDNTESQVITNVYKDCYKGIARANAVLDKVPQISFTDKALQERIIGEARFLRALYYFHLAKVYGAVPIIDRLIEGPNDPLYFPSRNPVEEVYAFIEADLKAAIPVLPNKGEYSAEDRGRATAGAAQGYLGKVYLYQKKFGPARDAFAEIINGKYGNYSLVDFEDNFTDSNENNAESVFEIQFVGGFGNIWAGDDTGSETESTYLGTLFGPKRFGNAYPSDHINAVFDDNGEANSLRRIYTIARPGDSWRSWDPVTIDQWNARIPDAGGSSAIRKGNLGPDETQLQSGINYRMMRYADVLLMFAEAENEANGPTALAYNAINQVRDRAGVAPLPAGLSKAEFFQKIKTERELEFAFEVSKYFDLIRWGLGSEMPGFKVGKNELIPIPASEIGKNENLLPNNPGW